MNQTADTPTHFSLTGVEPPAEPIRAGGFMLEEKLAIETLLALGLLIGWHLRWVSLATALFLLSFAVAMLVALGPKAPLDYSVFTSASAAFLLFAIQATRKNT
jgi:uncharacterized membrane protein YphA (DoxX/SURF4 family)